MTNNLSKLILLLGIAGGLSGCMQPNAGQSVESTASSQVAPVDWSLELEDGPYRRSDQRVKRGEDRGELPADATGIPTETLVQSELNLPGRTQVNHQRVEGRLETQADVDAIPKDDEDIEPLPAPSTAEMIEEAEKNVQRLEELPVVGPRSQVFVPEDRGPVRKEVVRSLPHPGQNAEATAKAIARQRAQMTAAQKAASDKPAALPAQPVLKVERRVLPDIDPKTAVRIEDPKAKPVNGEKLEVQPSEQAKAKSESQTREAKTEQRPGVKVELKQDSNTKITFEPRRLPIPAKRPVDTKVTDEKAATEKKPATPQKFAVATPDGRQVEERGILTPTVFFIAVINEDSHTCAGNKVTMHDASGKKLLNVCDRTKSFCAEQGSCIIKKNGVWKTYNVVRANRFAVITDACVYGYGVRQICLDPFYSVAADLSLYEPGDVIFVPKLRGQTLPNGQKHDGYVIVRDKGSGVKGKGRFDFFSGSMNWKNSSNAFVRLRLNDRSTDLEYQKVTGELAQRVRLKRGYPKLPTKGLVEMALATGNTSGVPTTPL